MKKPLIAPLLLAAAAPVLAQQPPDGASTRLALFAERSRLGAGYADWTENAIAIGRWWDRRRGLEATLTRTHRFDLTDTQAGLAYTWPLSAALTATAQLSASPSHHVLARRSASGLLQYEFLPGWLWHTGLKVSRYDTTEATQGTLALERYWGSFSSQLAWRPVRASY